jgi:8-oxo-dGTP pyrophosphatase MutT (NUDIX family)
MKVKQEFSAGGVVFKQENGEILFLVGKHSGYHKWVLPKGLIEQGEQKLETAVRETEEEMGVVAEAVLKEPIYTEKYFYVADFKKEQKTKKEIKDAKKDQGTRRVKQYQEGGGGKTKVAKTVYFFLLEYQQGSPEEHGWEMEAAGWYEYKKALAKLDFDGEKKALKKAKKQLDQLGFK